jgi:hypothetical protein
MGRHVACMGAIRNVYKILVRKHRHRWKDKIKMNEGVDRIHLAKGRDQWRAWLCKRQKFLH